MELRGGVTPQQRVDEENQEGRGEDGASQRRSGALIQGFTAVTSPLERNTGGGGWRGRR